MPDTPANQVEYPLSRTQKPGLEFPLFRPVAIISLSCGAGLDDGAMLGKANQVFGSRFDLNCRLPREDHQLAILAMHAARST